MSSICLSNQQIVGVVKDSKKIKNSETSYAEQEEQLKLLTAEMELLAAKQKRLGNPTVEMDILMDMLNYHEYAVKKKRKSIFSKLIESTRSTKTRIGAMSMSIQFPSAFSIFKDETKDLFTTGLSFKLSLATLFGISFSMGNISLETLASSFIFFIILAFADAIIGILPNARTQKKIPKDQKLQAKAWLLLMNFLAMIGWIAAHLLISNFFKEPNVFFKYTVINCHYYGIGFIITSYVYRIGKYIAIANKVKAPGFLKQKVNK
ncbi:hypothetical protein PDQ77_27410 [Bacillus cereus]|uniref:hypothetical protein n=1 Tax=Bacillaceae TaxID=186817 RepID=UPI000BFA1ED7|nr:hypothetical protein [Bacillus cereus]MDA2434509.1 hypothetical protein [Bacillus cereus]MDA2650471.1 hypothetical protein [Bacillus cereus]MDZ4545244.1 hypothetical protein [Bacillus cereus]MDZ4604083.1 hypothetical protein [Bacillus cereus]PEV23168.1 hypothetical protein CN419_28215 [Bacillus cereus]